MVLGKPGKPREWSAPYLVFGPLGEGDHGVEISDIVRDCAFRPSGYAFQLPTISTMVKPVTCFP
jgi:hypothetical protein